MYNIFEMSQCRAPIPVIGATGRARSDRVRLHPEGRLANAPQTRNVTQLIMSQLYGYIFDAEKTAGTLVSTCVAGDLHEIGVRMVTDFFEMAGWNTFYLGANMPTKSVLETVMQRKAHVLCISATISYHLGAVSELIQSVRAEPGCRSVKILVGAYPFNVAPDLWQKMEADGCAPNAQDAIILANQLTADGIRS